MTNNPVKIPPWLSVLPEDVAIAVLSGKPVDHATAVAAWNTLGEQERVVLMRDLGIFMSGVTLGAYSFAQGLAAGLALMEGAMRQQQGAALGNLYKFAQLSPEYGRVVWQTGGDPIGEALKRMESNGMNGNEPQ